MAQHRAAVNEKLVDQEAAGLKERTAARSPIGRGRAVIRIRGALANCLLPSR
jgi:hypothetical protein